MPCSLAMLHTVEPDVCSPLNEFSYQRNRHPQLFDNYLTGRVPQYLSEVFYFYFEILYSVCKTYSYLLSGLSICYLLYNTLLLIKTILTLISEIYLFYTYIYSLTTCVTQYFLYLLYFRLYNTYFAYNREIYNTRC